MVLRWQLGVRIGRSRYGSINSKQKIRESAGGGVLAHDVFNPYALSQHNFAS